MHDWILPGGISRGLKHPLKVGTYLPRTFQCGVPMILLETHALETELAFPKVAAWRPFQQMRSRTRNSAKWRPELALLRFEPTPAAESKEAVHVGMEECEQNPEQDAVIAGYR